MTDEERERELFGDMWAKIMVGFYHLVLEFGWQFDEEEQRWLKPDEVAAKAAASELRAGPGLASEAGPGAPVPAPLGTVDGGGPGSARRAEG